MKSKQSKELVIDANIARSAGTTEHPVSKNCRDCLETIKVCHKIVMSREIYQEWRKHQSGFAQTWLATMFAKGKVKKIEPPPHLRLIIDGLEKVSQKSIDAMQKDAHLLEAALVSDKIIISSDDTAKGLFINHLSNKATDIKQIMWNNPTTDEKCIEWLESGAEYRKEYLLLEKLR